MAVGSRNVCVGIEVQPEDVTKVPVPSPLLRRPAVLPSVNQR